jgi:hypothetical protein
MSRIARLLEDRFDESDEEDEELRRRDELRRGQQDIRLFSDEEQLLLESQMFDEYRERQIAQTRLQLPFRKINLGIPATLVQPICALRNKVSESWICAICQERDNPNVPDENQDAEQINAVRVISDPAQAVTCTHSFHFECIQSNYLVSEKCPICRLIIIGLSCTAPNGIEFEGRRKRSTRKRKSSKRKSSKRKSSKRKSTKSKSTKRKSTKS